MIYVLFGFFAGLACSFWVRKVHKLEAPLRIMLLVSVIGMLGISLVLDLENIFVFTIFLSINGIGIMGFVPGIVEAGIERLDHENLVTTVLFMFATWW